MLTNSSRILGTHIDKAHQHAANAEELTADGKLELAAKEHYEAAQAYHKCAEEHSDSKMKNTLILLYNNHCKVGKELQRKIETLRKDGKDPNAAKPSPRRPSAGPSYPDLHVVQHPPSSQQPKMNELQNTVDESFMLLGRSDPGDAFNQYWRRMEELLDIASQPVAFATAPLETVPAVSFGGLGSSSSDTEPSDAAASRMKRWLVPRTGSFASRSNDNTPFSNKMSYPPDTQATIIDLRELEGFEEEEDDDGNDSSDSFLLVTSKSNPSPSGLKKENLALKEELVKAQKTLTQMEKVLKTRQEHDQHLRDTFHLAKREAQRALGSSVQWQPRSGQQSLADLPQLNLTGPPMPVPPPTGPLGPNPHRDREVQFLRRIRELEEETKNLRIENDKQKAVIVKFRERWEKLKESNRRKKEEKEAKAAADALASVSTRVDDESELPDDVA